MTYLRADVAAASTATAGAATVIIILLLTTILATSGQKIVLDINFDDLPDAVQEFDFLAVAFYAPGCGHCRRLLPSWTQAAELLTREQQQTTIRLARMDVASAGGMGAWKAFGLNRVPTVKVFVDSSINDPLAYTGHLDASGIVAHLAMLERDHRRRRERESKYHYGNNNKHRNSSDGESITVVSPPDVSTLTVLLTSQLPTSRTPGGPRAMPAVEPSPSLLRERFREAIAGDGLTVVLFVFQGRVIGDGVEELPKLARQIIPYPASAVLILQLSPDSPRARRMVSEFYRAAEILAGNYPPMKAVHVDLSSSATDNRRSKGRKGEGESSREVAIAYRRELEAITGVSTFLGDNPELRIFLNGNPWVDGGGHHFRGMSTAEGIVEHMQWVAAEVSFTTDKRSDEARISDDSTTCAST